MPGTLVTPAPCLRRATHSSARRAATLVPDPSARATTICEELSVPSKLESQGGRRTPTLPGRARDGRPVSGPTRPGASGTAGEGARVLGVPGERQGAQMS